MKNVLDLPEKVMPTVTIGITCFNAEDTIADAIRSALAQSYAPKEIIVYDDCSTDASVKEVEVFVAAGQVALIRGSANRGYPSALNAIVAAASGDFVAFFDDDDLSKPNRISAQVKLLLELEGQQHNQDILCYSAREVVHGEANWTLVAIGNGVKRPVGMMVAEFILLGIERPSFSWGAFGSCTLCARRALFNRIGAFDPAFRRGTEWDYAIRAAARGVMFASVAEPLVVQRLTPGYGAEKSNAVSLQYTLKLRDKHADMFPSRAVHLAAKMWARARAAWARNGRFEWRFYAVVAGVLCPQILPTLIRKSKVGRFFGQPKRTVEDVLVVRR